MIKKYSSVLLIFILLIGGVVLVKEHRNTKKLSLFNNSTKTSSNIKQDNSIFSQDTENIPEAVAPETVTLHEGDVFDMKLTPVKKNINGQWVRMIGYNGSVPGPAITVAQGSNITIRLTNNSELETTLHSHGVRMDNAFDGVPDLTQKPIQPGETFEYKLKFPDAGAYWYHPHVRTDYTLESGLYGSYIVIPQENSYWSHVNREMPIMLDDISLDRNGLQSFEKDSITHALMGRFGNVMFTNGETNFDASVQKGEVVRLYLTNAANTRVFNFTIPGAKMKLVGADLGRYAQETSVQEIMIGPGERRIVDVYFETSGDISIIHKTPGKQYVLGKIHVSSDNVSTSYAKEFSVLRSNESVASEMNDLQNSYFAKSPDKKLRIDIDMNGSMSGMMNNDSNHRGTMGSGGHMMPDGTMMGGNGMGMNGDGDAIEWEDTMSMMNQMSDGKSITWKLTDEATGKSNMDIDDWTFSKDSMVKIRIFNDPKSMHPMQHPIHFHGQRFVVLATNGVRNSNPVWQDTALIPKGDAIDIIFEASNSGNWMTHCHILEHAENGMMFNFKVK